MTKSEMKKQSARLMEEARTWLTERFGQPHDYLQKADGWNVETKVGRLHLALSSTHDGGVTLYGRFDQPAEAVRYFGADSVNKFSGKWNAHWWAFGKEHDADWLPFHLRTWYGLLQRVLPEG